MPKRNNGAYLELNDRGVWEVRWTDNGRSKRLSTRTQDRQEAARFLAGFLLENDRQKTTEITVNEVLDLYLDEHVDNGPVIDKRRQHDIADNLRPFLGPMLPDQITPDIINTYGAKRRAGETGKPQPKGRPCRRVRSPGTLRRELNMLRAAFGHAIKAKRLEATELPYIPLPTPNGAKDLWLDETESVQFIATAKRAGSRRAYLFILIALHTASRRRAVETLTWERIDLGAGLIHFQPQGRAQSIKRRVPVPISRELRAELEAVPKEQRTGYVLGTDLSIVRAFETVMRAAAKEHDNPKFLAINRHTLRHTWATQAARAGVDLYQIAGVLGDSLATVQRNYLHHSPDHLRAAVDFRNADRIPADAQGWKNGAYRSAQRGGTAQLGV